MPSVNAGRNPARPGAVELPAHGATPPGSPRRWSTMKPAPPPRGGRYALDLDARQAAWQRPGSSRGKRAVATPAGRRSDIERRGAVPAWCARAGPARLSSVATSISTRPALAPRAPLIDDQHAIADLADPTSTGGARRFGGDHRGAETGPVPVAVRQAAERPARIRIAAASPPRIPAGPGPSAAYVGGRSPRPAGGREARRGASWAWVTPPNLDGGRRRAPTRRPTPRTRFRSSDATRRRSRACGSPWSCTASRAGDLMPEFGP